MRLAHQSHAHPLYERRLRVPNKIGDGGGLLWLISLHGRTFSPDASAYIICCKATRSRSAKGFISRPTGMPHWTMPAQDRGVPGLIQITAYAAIAPPPEGCAKAGFSRLLEMASNFDQD